MWSILNRTILWDLIKIFVLSLVSITGLLLLAVVVMEAQNQGLGPLQILAIIPLIIPTTMPYTLPATTLFATCVVYGRMAHDNEILAIRAAGINLMHVVWPSALLGLVMSVATAALYHQVIPTTYHMMKTLFLADIENVLYGILKRDGRFSHPNSEYVITVKKVDGRKLIKSRFMHRDPKTMQFDVVAEAREAELRVDHQNKKLLIHMRHCYVSSSGDQAGVYLEDNIWEIDIPEGVDGSERKLRRSDMTWDELLVRLEDLQTQLEQKDQEIARHTGQFTLAAPPDLLAQHLHHLRNQKKMIEQQIRDIEAELQRRPALALGCLCFVLVGCPVGIWFSRSDYLSAFVTCFLPIVLLYYPLVLCGENLARSGSVDPTLAIWSPNIFMALIAFWLYRRLLRH